MTANEQVDRARAAKEALDTVARRTSGGRGGAAADALQRYLASEAFHEQRREEDELEDTATPRPSRRRGRRSSSPDS